MSYKIRGGKIAKELRRPLYHFTVFGNIDDILRDGLLPSMGEGHLLPGRAAVWLTSDPAGNTITEADLERWHRRGNHDLIAEHENGRRWKFGDNEHGTARITVDTKHAQHYLGLMRTTYADAPEVLATLTGMTTHLEINNWYVSLKPISVKRIIDVELFTTALGEQWLKEREKAA
jgi:hypothetical protein